MDHDANAPVPEHILVLQRLSSQPRSPSTAVHFLAMMIKNARQKLRTPVGTLLEMLLPLVFVLGLMAIWAATDDGGVKDTQYVNTTGTVTTPPDWIAAIAPYMCTNGSTTLPYVRACTSADFDPNAKVRATCGYDNFRIPVPGLCVVGDGYSALKGWADFKTVRNLPSMDEMILWQWLARMVVSDKARTQNYGKALASSANAGELWFGPNTTATAPLIKQLMSYFDSNSLLFSRINHRIVPDIDAARSQIATNELSDTVWAIVEVAISSSPQRRIDVTLHMNRSGVPYTNQALVVGNGAGEFSTGPYIASGFLTLQDLVFRFYESQILNIPTPKRLVHIPMPFLGYSTSSFLVVIGALASLFLVFGYIYPVSQLVKRIVEEKEEKVREAMMIMGLSTAPFYCSWVLTYFIMQVVTSLICAGVLKGTMFPKSDFAIIWALYFMFGLSNITFSSMVSSFFSKSRIAALVAPVIFFICAVPSFALPSTTPAGILIVISVLSPTAFANGMNVLVNQEVTGGLTNASINESFNGYPMSVAILMLGIDTVAYMLLTLYFDAVLPGEWGTHENPCFCFVNPWRWFQRRQGHEDHEGEDLDGRDVHGEFEATTPHTKPSVEMRGMRKVFDTSAGRMVAVNNLTFNLYENQVFCLLGHNGAGKSTAMNMMTGMLEMDGGDCYFHGHSVKHDLAKVRREVGYCPQHNILWAELTCREHLHFYARLKGLDAEMREIAVNAVLKAVDLEDKAEKYSSELSGGQKRKLSVAIAFVGGSSVVFLDEPTAGMDVEARRHTWDLIKNMAVGRTIVLTTHYMEEADLLGHTIAIMSKGRLKCAGSSVFLKSRLGVGYNFTVTCEHGVRDTTHIVEAVHRFVPDAAVLSDAAGEISLRLPMAAVPQFPNLLRHFENNASQLGVRGHGISVTTLEEIFLKLGHDDEAEAAEAKAAEASHSAISVTEPSKESKELMFTPEVAACRPTWKGQFQALLVKRFHYAKRDTRTIVMQVVLPVVAILFAMLLTLIKFPDAPKLDIDPGLYSDTVTSAYGNCPANWNMYTVNDTVSINSNLVDDITFSNYLLKTSKAHARHRIGSYLCSDNAIATPATTFFTNTSIYAHAGPEAVWEVHTPFIQYGVGGRVQTRISSYPFPLSPRESGFFEGIRTLFIALFVMIPFTFVPSTFVSFVVKERETRSLQLQQASGLKFLIYWASNFIFDLSSFFITAVLVIVIFGIFNRTEYIGDAPKFFATLVLFMLYGTGGVGSSYIMSFAFDSHSTAQNIVMLVNFICGFMLVLLAYILSIIDSTKDAGEVLRYFFRVIPSYCLGEGILNLANNDFLAGYSVPKSTWSMDVVGWPMLYLAIEAPIFIAITMYLDSPLRRSQQQALSHSDVIEAPSEHEDDDVAIERQEIESGQRDATDVVVVKHLRKVYHGSSTLVAVKNLSFGIHRGEVFGFLGTNGAGKTTTISILCGEHMPSGGSGYIGGFDVVGQASEARQLIGYCPQFDATHDLLTIDEHLELYCGLHGIDGTLRAEVIERLVNLCGLTDHRSKESRNLSGGNRRKLSVAISLIGAPQVVFLDEPSAGMDPMARRGLFDVIEQVARRCAVVLTTHHLEEVEALSNRVGIMVKGEMRCIGPLGHLKSKFGTGFEMTVRVIKDEQVDACIAFIHGNMKKAVIQERRGTKLTVALPQSTKLSEVFQLVENNKMIIGITDYSVAQTSLESVFLHIADEK